MPDFIPGQRWISDTESELGLGTVVQTEERTVSLLFKATGEMRTYAKANAPLRRIQFAVGETVESLEGWRLTIEDIQSHLGLLIYHGIRDEKTHAFIPEGDLNPLIRFSKPHDRLFAGKSDSPHWFDLRYQTLQHLGRLEQSPTLGLAGARIDLIPHQLYIAHEVSNRPAPRVLLADEVGLGKTIEACLILHHQLLTGRASRVLILVPEPLLHQWLVELLRRFNLRFSIFDEERCQAVVESGQALNPFLAEQFVLCALDLFKSHPDRFPQALRGEWDLLIVDEAHHLTWSEAEPSAEYLLVEALAYATPGLLLLTATPEQLGREGHFARLRLLDPDRYYDYSAFLKEEENYQPVAAAVEMLLQGDALPKETGCRLLERLGESDSKPLIDELNTPETSPERRNEIRQVLIDELLDRHGTGRVLFRNTRSQIKGFPGREVHTYPLTAPSAYLDSDQMQAERSSIRQHLAPERFYQNQGEGDWWELDPRVSWLGEFLREHKTDKILLICAQAQTVIELQEVLRARQGISAAVFHERMTIIERDRNAAWFADSDNGARILLCSEIGSEGRNFQFAHHLVLFDLPFDADLLEQRIGRLDRIGQRETIQIHVPYLEPGPQAVMLHWYHLGLGAFLQHVPGARLIQDEMQQELLHALGLPRDDASLVRLIETTRQRHAAIQQRLLSGRDHLLELAACREPQAGQLVEQLRMQDQDPSLPRYLEQVFSSFNIDSDPLGQESHIIRPDEQVTPEPFPGLDAEGLTLTYSRETALAREDQLFFTWEHPLVREVMERIVSQELGNSCAISVKLAGLKPGQLLLEALFVLQPLAPRNLQATRFLPPTLIRLLINEGDERLDATIGCNEITGQAAPMDASVLNQLLQHYRDQIKRLVHSSQKFAEAQTPGLIGTAVNRMMQHYTGEIQRLIALKRHNPNVRKEEIEILRKQGLELHQHLKEARLRLDAVRLIVTT